MNSSGRHRKLSRRDPSSIRPVQGEWDSASYFPKNKELFLFKGANLALNLGLSIMFGLLTATGFGTADFLAKLCTNRIGFLRTALFMQLIGSLFVLPFAVPDASRLITQPWAVLGGILVGVANALATLFLYKGFEVGRLSIVSPIASTAPVVAILLAIAFLGESLTVERFSAISLVVIGIILVSVQAGGEDFSKQITSGTIYALGFMLLGGLVLFGLKPVSNALGVFLPVLIIRWVGVFILAAPLVAQRLKVVTSGAFRLIVAVAFFDTFANVAYNLGVTHGTVTIVSPLGGMFSAVTVLLACIFLKEKLSRHQVLGFIAICIGVGMLGIFG